MQVQLFTAVYIIIIKTVTINEKKNQLHYYTKVFLMLKLLVQNKTLIYNTNNRNHMIIYI